MNSPLLLDIKYVKIRYQFRVLYNVTIYVLTLFQGFRIVLIASESSKVAEFQFYYWGNWGFKICQTFKIQSGQISDLFFYWSAKKNLSLKYLINIISLVTIV